MATNATLTGQDAVQPGDEIVRSYRFTDPTTAVCCALCTLTFAYWSYSLVGSLTFPGLAFLTLLPPTLFMLGRGLLGLIRSRPRPIHSRSLSSSVPSLPRSCSSSSISSAPLPLRG